MSKRFHPDWIDAYIRHTNHTEAPTAFHFWTAVSTIAGALQRRVYIDQKSFEWVPNFYIVLIGPAGLVTKSTSLRFGEKLLKGVGKKIRFGSQSGSWQSMAEEIRSAALQMPGGIMSCPISYFVSELGTFLAPDNREQVDFFVDSWDAQRTSFTRTTKSGGLLEITCPCVNILAGTTHTWIKENFTATMIGGGFVSRLIFVRGSHKRKLIAYPGLEVQTAEFLESQNKLLEDLKRIALLEGPMRLTDEAVAWGKDWYEKHWTQKRQLTGERFDGFYARKQTHLHKLAAILSVSRGDDLIITLDDLKKAHATLLIVEKDLAGVIDNVTSKQISTQHKREIVSVIQAEGGIEREELYAQLYQMMSGIDFDRAITDLTKAKQIVIRPQAGRTMLHLKEAKVISFEDEKKKA